MRTTVEILEQHVGWLKGNKSGRLYWGDLEESERANLRGADLCEANLCRADLREANLREANLCRADLCGADLRGAYLCEANLCGANLREADLCRADLCEANLRGADLCRANLREANLREANLCRADLCGADLCRANLCRADLCGADLRGAYLYEANLCGANLREADLCRADLCGANLCGANLCGANLRESSHNHLTIGVHPAPQGTLIVWGKKSGHIVKMEVGEDVPRSCATTRKHRSASVLVLEIDDGEVQRFEHAAPQGQDCVYKVGEVTTADSWDEDRWNECSHGIHWFLTREEAEAWG